MDKLIVNRLIELDGQIRSSWNCSNSSGTRYFIVDDLLPINMAQEIFGAFPVHGEQFNKRKSFREKKKTLAKLELLPKVLTDISFALQDDAVVRKVEELTGMQNLVGDPQLYAGGLSMMFKGDFLNPHIDNSHESKRELYRRLNLLYYVTPDWNEQNGGNFELWDRKVSDPITIVPKFNRLVVMETNDSSWHSVSKVNVDTPRCCVSNYFFSKQSPKMDREYYHVTSFTGRPDEPLKRIFGRVDNIARQFVASRLGISRGKDLVNKTIPKE